MSVVVGASVFIAASRDEEPEHETAKETLRQLAQSSMDVYCPALILPECSGAMIRLTRNPDAVTGIITTIERFPRLTLVSVEPRLAGLAANAAAYCHLRGADACYVATANVQTIPLITLDREMLQRGAAIVRTMTPAQWLQEKGTNEDS